MKTSELADRTGTTKRTIRYYLAEGLLPPAEMKGSHMEFGREHELRLRLIKHLQGAGVKLGAVKQLIRGYSLAQVEELVDAFDRGETPSLPEATVLREPPLTLLYANSARIAAEAQVGEEWRRVRLADDVELHVHYPLSPEREQLIAELLKIARERLGA